MAKKILTILLAILFIISMVPICYAAGTPSLSITNITASPGETFAVKLTLKNNPGIISANLTVEFDDGLTLVDATNGDVFSALSYIPPKQLSAGKSIESECRFAWMGFDIKDKDIKNGTILTMYFMLDDSAQKGTYNITVYGEKGNVIDKNLNELFLSAKSKVTVTDNNSSQSLSPLQNMIQKILDFIKNFIEKISSVFSPNN